MKINQDIQIAVSNHEVINKESREAKEHISRLDREASTNLRWEV